MQRRDRAERLRAHAIERRERRAEPRDERLRGIEIAGRELAARIGRDAAVSRAEARQRVREAGRARLRPRSAQDRELERRDGARVAPGRRAEAETRVLEQRQQRHRRQPFERGFGREPCEHAGLGVGQRIAAGIVGHDVPAPERGADAARQRAVRRHQRGGLVCRARLRAARPRSRAPPLRRSRPRSR